MRVDFGPWRRAAACAGLLVLGAISPALGQLPNPSLGQAAPDPAPLDAAKAAFEKLPEADRIAIQDALVWTGDYSSVADGTFGRRTFEAIQAYQRRARQSPTGILDRAAFAGLAAAGARARSTAGFAAIDDAATGIRIGIPQKLLPKRSQNSNGGSRFQSADGKVTLDTRALPGREDEMREIYERNLAIQTPGRQVTYRLAKPDMFVIAGETPGGRFYTRYGQKDGSVRGFSIGYDKALAAELDRVVVAISNSFAPFPGGPPPRPPAVAGGGGTPAPNPSASRPPAANFTGLAVTARRVLVSAAAAESCRDPLVDGGPARLVSTDKARGLALLEPSVPHRTVPYRLAPAARVAAEGGGLVVFIAPGEGGRPVAVPADLLANGRLYAPLQDGASGGVVLDGQGQVAGIVGTLASGARMVAGLVPPASHPFSPAGEIRAVLGPDAPAASPAPAPRTSGLGALAAALSPALARITCPAPMTRAP